MADLARLAGLPAGVAANLVRRQGGVGLKSAGASAGTDLFGKFSRAGNPTGGGTPCDLGGQA